MNAKPLSITEKILMCRAQARKLRLALMSGPQPQLAKDCQLIFSQLQASTGITATWFKHEDGVVWWIVTGMGHTVRSESIELILATPGAKWMLMLDCLTNLIRTAEDAQELKKHHLRVEVGG